VRRQATCNLPKAQALDAGVLDDVHRLSDAGFAQIDLFPCGLRHFRPLSSSVAPVPGKLVDGVNNLVDAVNTPLYTFARRQCQRNGGGACRHQ
jgi:hypothetical protein